MSDISPFASMTGAVGPGGRRRKTPHFAADVDSAPGMVRALARYLHGRDNPGPSFAPSWLHPLVTLVNTTPRSMREPVYTRMGWLEAIPARLLHRVHAEAMSRWVIAEYPRRPWPAVALGSASGGMIHLCAALGIPWLPQTFLVPTRWEGIDLDEPKQAMDWGARHGPRLLEANPDLVLHHMHDPNQDRLMLRHMAYFRVKRTRLGECYERYLRETLPPGGTLLLFECGRGWPTTRVADRHVFQSGAVGGASEGEYLEGSPRVAAFLERYGSRHRRWDSPAPDGVSPEAEWGFEPALRADVERFARLHGYRVRRVRYDEPHHLSPLAADLYRWWYRRRGRASSRLLIGSFLCMEPFWAVRTGSVPFWMTVNTETSLRWIEQYLDEGPSWDEIYLTLFSHGVNSVGLPRLERWRAVIDRARRRGSFLGMDLDRFPRDLGVFMRYHQDLPRRIAARHAMPGPLHATDLEAFLHAMGDRYPVRWDDATDELEGDAPWMAPAREPLIESGEVAQTLLLRPAGEVPA